MKLAQFVSLIVIVGGLVYSISSAPLDVTYIANEGFLLESGDHKILIDALFTEGPSSKYLVPSQGLIDKMVAGTPPFDDIDAVLVTHYHWDHFDAETAVRFLKHHPKTFLVGSQQVHDKLKTVADYNEIATQVKVIDSELHKEEELFLNEIDIKAIQLRHSPYMENGADRHRNVQNLAYFVNMGSQRIFHMGDAGMYNNKDFFHNYDFAADQIDVLFGPWFGILSQSIVNERIKPKVIIPMHIASDEWDRVTQKFLKTYPHVTVFKKSMEGKTFDLANRIGK